MVFTFFAAGGSASYAFADEATMKKAWEYYLKGDHEKSLDACRLASKSQMLGDEGHYLMGMALLNLKDFQQARMNFAFILENYPHSSKRPEATLGIADSYFLEGTFDKTEGYYKELLKEFPKTDYAASAYFRLGLSQRNQGKWQEAGISLNKVIRDYPLSPEAEEAGGLLEKKTVYFTIQIGAFSKKENAQRLSKQLNRKGYDAQVEKVYKNDKQLYCVKIGNFNTEKDAEREAAKLKKAGFNTKICI
jgi:tetratricopeptide (TPR) repeat protein